MSFLTRLAGPAFACAVMAVALTGNSKIATAEVDPGSCIRCEAFGDTETCKRCLDTPTSTKATVPAACKAAAAECKTQINSECKTLGNPAQFMSCLKEDKKCAAAVTKCQ